MATIKIREARLADVEYLVADMRAGDAEELRAQGHSREEGALGSLQASEVAWSVWHEGRLLAMLGVRSEDALSGYACVWLLSTNAVEGARFAFYKASRQWIEFLNRQWPVLYNYVDSRYTRAVAWLERLGFKTEELGLLGDTIFYKMVRREE